MSWIFWDTNLFIYLLEDYRELSERVQNIRSKMLERGDQLLTSTFTLGELLVKPMETGALELCKRCEEALVNSTILPFDVKAATHHGRLRSDPPDAIQLARAGAARVDLFITNDERLQSKHVEGIHFLTSLRRSALDQTGSPRFQIHVLDGQIPVGLEDFEATLLFLFVGVLVGEELFL
jgi:predicted nucleic acid-binding protein